MGILVVRPLSAEVRICPSSFFDIHVYERMFMCMNVVFSLSDSMR